MKKLILAIFLVCVLAYTSILADIDTFEGQATDNLSHIEGQEVPADIEKIEGQTIDSGPSFIIDEDFVGYTDVSDGVFIDQPDAYWTVVNDAAQGEQINNTMAVYIWTDLPASYDEFTVEFTMKVDDLTMLATHTGYAEIVRFSPAGLAAPQIARVLWYGEFPCTDPCDFDRARYYFLEDTGTSSTPISDVTANFVDDTYTKWKIYYAKSATPNSGIMRVWVDDVLEYENTAVDNDQVTEQIGRIYVRAPGHSFSANATYSKFFTIDYVKGNNSEF